MQLMRRMDVKNLPSRAVSIFIHIITQVSSILGNVLANASEIPDAAGALYAPERQLLQNLLRMADNSRNTEVG